MADGRGLRGLSLQRVYPRPPGLGCRDDIGPAFSALTPLPGQSLVPALQGKPLGERTLAWEHEGNRAVRVGDWEPYDLSRDRAELTNLAAQQSAKVKELTAAWQAWADKVGVVPWEQLPGASYKPGATYRKKGEAVPPVEKQ